MYDMALSVSMVRCTSHTFWNVSSITELTTAIKCVFSSSKGFGGGRTYTESLKKSSILGQNFRFLNLLFLHRLSIQIVALKRLRDISIFYKLFYSLNVTPHQPENGFLRATQRLKFIKSRNHVVKNNLQVENMSGNHGEKNISKPWQNRLQTMFFKLFENYSTDFLHFVFLKKVIIFVLAYTTEMYNCY